MMTSKKRSKPTSKVSVPSISPPPSPQKSSKQSLSSSLSFLRSATTTPTSSNQINQINQHQRFCRTYVLSSNNKLLWLTLFGLAILRIHHTNYYYYYSLYHDNDDLQQQHHRHHQSFSAQEEVNHPSETAAASSPSSHSGEQDQAQQQQHQQQTRLRHNNNKKSAIQKGRQYTLSFQTKRGKWRHPIRPINHVSMTDLTDLQSSSAGPASDAIPKVRRLGDVASQQRTVRNNNYKNKENNKNDNDKDISDNNEEELGKSWIMERLYEAGVESLDEDVFQALPTDAGIQSLYYSSSSSAQVAADGVTRSSRGLGDVVVQGLDRCQQYRQNVPNPLERLVGVAGLFNTGTTALSLYLQNNLKLPILDTLEKEQQRQQQTLLQQYWSDPQVPWGKHRLLHLKDDPAFQRKEWKQIQQETTATHYAAVQLEPHNVLPIVAVRDPYFWMQSMCESPYMAQWDRDPNNCPHLLLQPTTTSSSSSSSSTTIPVRLPTQQSTTTNDNTTAAAAHFDSLAHLWNHWYQEYVEYDQPRLFVRMEDLLLHPQAVLSQIQECILPSEGEEEAEQQSKNNVYEKDNKDNDKNNIDGDNTKTSSVTSSSTTTDSSFVYLMGRSKWSQEYLKPQSSRISSIIKYAGHQAATKRLHPLRPSDEVPFADQVMADLMDWFGYKRPQQQQQQLQAAVDLSLSSSTAAASQ